MKVWLAYPSIIICSITIFLMGFSFAFSGAEEDACTIAATNDYAILDICRTVQYHMIFQIALTVLMIIAILIIYKIKRGKNESG